MSFDNPISILEPAAGACRVAYPSGDSSVSSARPGGEVVRWWGCLAARICERGRRPRARRCERLNTPITAPPHDPDSDASLTEENEDHG
jgi:hypothetical protein